MSTIDRIRKDDFRVNFLRKLSYERVLVPASQRPPKSQTVIIFDWDDTLLCTSFLNSSGSKPRSLTATTTRRLQEIGKVSQTLLETACRMGRTFIITNAMDGWVEWSASTWAPELLPVLRNVRVISARTRYEPEFPMHLWKVQAFLEVQRELDDFAVTNLLSVGDSDYEMDAAHVMGKQFSEALIKTIKLQQQPTPEDLHKELVLVAQKFERIVENAKPLKVCLERKYVGQAAPAAA